MDHYGILRVERTASPEVIKSAYRKMCSQFHPDRNPGKDTTREMQDINAAHAVLSDQSARAVYDRTMGFGSSYADALRKAAYDAEMADLLAKATALAAAARSAAARVAAENERREQREREQQERERRERERWQCRAEGEEKQKPQEAPKPKRTKQSKAEKAEKAEKAAQEQQKVKDQEMRVELTSEIRKLCNTPPNYALNPDGVKFITAWKVTATKAYRFANAMNESIEVLTSVRDGLIRAGQKPA